MKYLFALLIPIACASQVRIEGLGPFKLNRSTVAIIDSISKEIKKKVMICTDITQQSKYENKAILDLRVDSTTNVQVFASYTNDVRVFMISNYNLLGKYKLGTLLLKFYKDTLAEIEIIDFDTQLNQDLETKYGQGSLVDVSDKDVCYVGQERFELANRKFMRTWEDSTNYISLLIGTSRQMDNCEIYHLNNLTVLNKENSKAMNIMNAEAETLYNENIKNKKKKTLAGL